MDKQLAQLIYDLETDRVVSSEQLERYYNLSLTDLEKGDFKLVEAFLALSQGSSCYQRVVFVGLTSSLRRLEASSLRHLAGVGEMRRMMGAPTVRWLSLAAAQQQPRTPDALWETSRGCLAIEYDVGSYSPNQIEGKAQSFKRYAGQVWGTPSRQRVRHLYHLIRPIDRRCVVLHAPWI